MNWMLPLLRIIRYRMRLCWTLYSMICIFLLLQTGQKHMRNCSRAKDLWTSSDVLGIIKWRSYKRYCNPFPDRLHLHVLQQLHTVKPNLANRPTGQGGVVSNEGVVTQERFLVRFEKAKSCLWNPKLSMCVCLGCWTGHSFKLSHCM